jgi:hypothetical protein
MRRLLFVVLLVLVGVSQALSQKTVSGVMTLAFGSYRGLDGKLHSAAGMKLPYTAELVRVGIIGKTTDWTPFSHQSPQSAGTVYKADGSGYGMLDDSFADPSSLDDVTMMGGAGTPWSTLKFGVHVGANREILMRWLIWDNYAPGPNGVQAFTGLIEDFGGHITLAPNNPGEAWIITINVAGFPITCPDNTIYIAQQIRHPNYPPGFPFLENGEGAFDTDMRNVYDVNLPPAVGSSDPTWFYDYNMDGIYSADEIDQFTDPGQPPPPYANMVREIVTSGSSESCSPVTYTVTSGYYSSGGIFELLQSDNEYLYLGTLNPTSPVRVEFETQAQSANLTGLRFQVETGTQAARGTLQTELWNYPQNRWDIVDTRAGTLVDSSYEVVIQQNPGQYINSSTRRLKSRLTWSATDTSRDTRTASLRIDLIRWVLSHP